MAFQIGFGSNQQDQTQTVNQSQSGSQRQSSRSTGTSSRRIEEAGALETGTLEDFMKGIMENFKNAGDLATGGINDAIAEGENYFNQLIDTGAKSALATMAKSGFKSSMVSNLFGAAVQGASGHLAGNLMNLKATMPLQAISAINSSASPIAQMLQGYFQQGRAQNVDTEQRGYTVGSNVSRSEGTSTGTTSQSSGGFKIGFGG